MRRIFSTRLTTSSFVLALLLCALAASAARRPRYGGTLTVELAGRVTSLDPAQLQASREDQIAQERLLTLLADSLVTLDEHGQPLPSLAASWQHDTAFKHWEFLLRADAKFQDGTLTDSNAVISSLKATNPGWQASGKAKFHDVATKTAIFTLVEQSISIDFDTPQPDLLYILAEPRNSILLRKSFGAVVGSGPFRITTWEPGLDATFAANDDYWAGRPFLESVDIQMGRAARDRMMDLDLGKADVVEVSPESARLAAARGSRTSASDSSELVALVFLRSSAAAKDNRLRQSLSLTIDCASLFNVVLQKEGDPAGALLPQWSTGYGFLFSAPFDPAAAQKLAAQISPSPALKLGYDSADALERMIAERIVVNAQAAGISIAGQPLANDSSANAPAVDARLIRLEMPSPVPEVSLENFIRLLAPLADLDASLTAPLDNPAAPDSLYARERAILDTYEIIPLVHLPQVAGLSPRVRDWTTSRLGAWRLSDVWLDGAPQ